MLMLRRYDPDANRLLLEVYGRWIVGLTIPVVLTCNFFLILISSLFISNFSIIPDTRTPPTTTSKDIRIQG